MTDHFVPISDRADLASRPLSNAGRATYPPRGTFGPRVQFDYQLVLVHSGTAQVTVDGVPREIPAGHVGLLWPGRVETFAFARHEETRHSWLAAAPQALAPDEHARLATVSTCLPLSVEMQSLVEVARAVAAIDDPIGCPLLLAVARAALTLYSAESTQLASARRAEHPLVVEARRLAREHATDGWGVAQVAAAVAVSPEHLARLFRRQDGTTPGALLRAERLAQAVQLLEQTGLSVAEVARRCGFASPHHFARCVRAATGMTPGALRQRHWVATEAPPASGSRTPTDERR